MKPLTEQLKKLEGIPVPDFGPLDDWAANRNAEMQHRARRAAGKAWGLLAQTMLSHTQAALLSRLCKPQAITFHCWKLSNMSTKAGSYAGMRFSR